MGLLQLATVSLHRKERKESEDFLDFQLHRTCLFPEEAGERRVLKERKETKARQGFQGNQVSPGGRVQWGLKETHCWDPLAHLESLVHLESQAMAGQDPLGLQDLQDPPPDTAQLQLPDLQGLLVLQDHQDMQHLSKPLRVVRV